MILLPSNCAIVLRPQMQPESRSHSLAGLSRVGVRACGHETCSPEYRVDRPDGFHSWGLEYVVRGEGWFAVGDGRKRKLGPGNVFSYLKRHAYGADRRNPMTKYWLCIRGPGLERLALETLGTPEGVVEVGDQTVIESLFSSIVREALERGRDGAPVCDLYLQILLQKIVQLRTLRRERPGGAYTTFNRCRTAIEMEYERLHGLGGVAAKHGVSVAHLCRLFRRYLGTSPHQYLTRLKLSRAAQMLRGSQQPIKAIASDLKFGDQYMFSKVFKKHYGVSPAKFREVRE